MGKKTLGISTQGKARRRRVSGAHHTDALYDGVSGWVGAR